MDDDPHHRGYPIMPLARGWAPGQAASLSHYWHHRQMSIITITLLLLLQSSHFQLCFGAHGNVWVYIIHRKKLRRSHQVIKVQPKPLHCRISLLPRRRVCTCLLSFRSIKTFRPDARRKRLLFRVLSQTDWDVLCWCVSEECHEHL